MKNRKLKSLIIVLLLGLSFSANAQFFVPGGFWSPRNAWMMNRGMRGFNGMPFVTYSSSGNYFLNPEWSTGRILINGKKTIEGLPLRYDLEHHRMEIESEEGVKMLKLQHIEAFEWINAETDKIERFVNAFHYELDGVPLVGVLEVVEEGPYTLYLLYDVNFSSGFQPRGFYSWDWRYEERYSKYRRYFLGTGPKLLPLEKKLKANQKLFGTDYSAIESFAKQNKLSFRKREDLAQIIRHYNSINKVE